MALKLKDLMTHDVATALNTMRERAVRCLAGISAAPPND